MLRYMDPHSPYLPPAPFDRMFYSGDEFDPANKSMEPVWAFKPFSDYFATWMPPGLTDREFVIAQYDGAVAYMDAWVGGMLAQVSALGLDDDTLVIITADHGEALDEHGCYFDHHGLYDCVLRVPLIVRMPGQVPAGLRLPGACMLQDVAPLALDVLGVSTQIQFDGRSLLPEMKGKRRKPTGEFYITECTWMRKHGWRTPQWKLIHALEPDFHFKPEVELYNLVNDPEENHNLAEKEPDVVALLEKRMGDWIARRERETGQPNPMLTNLRVHLSQEKAGPFQSSQEAYDALRINPLEPGRRVQTPLERLRALGYA